MVSLKQIRLEEKAAVEQREVICELNTLAKDIARCEQTIIDLKAELETVNATHPSPRTTREDIAYLSGLLECAKKKLAWEKLLVSVRKRAPLTLEKMTRLLEDPKAPPAEDVRAEMLKSLQAVQAAMERLQEIQLG